MGSSTRVFTMGRFLFLLTLLTFIVIILSKQDRTRTDLEENQESVDLVSSDRVVREASEKKTKKPGQDQKKKLRKKTRTARRRNQKKAKKPKKGKKSQEKQKKRNKGKGAKKKKCKGRNCKDNKNKGKKNKNKRRKRAEKKKKFRQSTCSSGTANRTCMEAAILGMQFERDQITNYLKQSKLLSRHQTLSGNKADKHDGFKEAKDHLLWAIGGNWSDPKCGPNDTSSGRYNSTKYAEELQLAKTAHDVLLNCSVAIKAACNMSNLDDHDSDGVSENITLCKDMKKDAVLANTRCQSLTTDVDAQCACWINQTILIKRIKEAKCQIKDSQKKVTQFKNNCIKIFGQCQRMMDKSVESVYYCMDDHSMSFINQTTDSLASSINRDAARRFNLDRFLTDFDEKFSN